MDRGQPAANGHGRTSEHPSGPKGQQASSTPSQTSQQVSTPNSSNERTLLSHHDIIQLLSMGVSKQKVEDLVCRQLSNGEIVFIVCYKCADDFPNIQGKPWKDQDNADPGEESLLLSLLSNNQGNITVTSERRNPQQTVNGTEDHPFQSVPKVEHMNEQSTPEEHDKESSPDNKGGDGCTSSLKYENHQLKDQMLCKICLDRNVCVVFLNCGHMVTCVECSPSIRKCPICRKWIKGRIKVAGKS